MTRQKYDDDCPGCRPTMINTETGEVFPPDSSQMKAVMEVWATLTIDEKQSFHRCCCLNSRDEKDLIVMQTIVDRLQGRVA